MFVRLSLAWGLLFAVAPLEGQSQTQERSSSHATAVVRPLSFSPDSTGLLPAIAETTRAHIVVGLQAAGVQILDRSTKPVNARELVNFVTAHFAVVGVVGMADSQLVMIVRLSSMDGDSLSQVRLMGSPTSAAAFGDSLASLFAPTILGRPSSGR